MKVTNLLRRMITLNDYIVSRNIVFTGIVHIPDTHHVDDTIVQTAIIAHAYGVKLYDDSGEIKVNGTNISYDEYIRNKLNYKYDFEIRDNDTDTLRDVAAQIKRFMDHKEFTMKEKCSSYPECGCDFGETEIATDNINEVHGNKVM